MKKYSLCFVVVALIVSSFFSCATFSKKTFHKEIQNLERENISKLEGNYTLEPIKKYSYGEPEVVILQDKVSDSLIANNAYRLLVTPQFNLSKEEFFKYENAIRSITLKFQNEDKLSLKVYENSILVKDTLLSGKYKNGMFYLDNKFLKCNGLPYIFGGCKSSKRRIGFTKKGNLLVNEAVSNDGAFLLFIWNGYAYNSCFEYKRIQ